MSYAAFPTANPAVVNDIAFYGTWTLSTGSNATMVSDAQQDGLTSYVYDSAPGDTDLYTLAPLSPPNPSSVVATTVRSLMQKSDAGSRNAAAVMKSGATQVNSPALPVPSSSWGWAWRTDQVDPNTGAPWAPSAVNNLQIGQTVVS
jgi:hypothetical protein